MSADGGTVLYDISFPIAPIIRQLNSGEISPSEAAEHIRQLQDAASGPVRMPPVAFFAALPEEEREKAREVFRILTEDLQG